MVSVARGRALNWAGIIAQHGEFDHQQQRALLEQSVEILRQAGDQVELSLALRHLWSNRAYGVVGTPTPDTALLEESLAIARAASDQREVGWGLLYLTQVALSRCDLSEARRLADEALVALGRLDPNSHLNALVQVGRVALAQGEHTRAESIFHEVLERSHDIGDRLWLSEAWLGLAGSVLARGDLLAARGCIGALVRDLRAASLCHLLPRALLGLAMLEAGAGRDESAARLLGAFEAAGASAMGWPLEGYYLGPDLATLRGRLQHEPFGAARAKGRALAVEQALDEALADEV